MNSIAKKIILVLAIVFGLYTILLYSFVRLVIVPTFNRLQEADAAEEVARCGLLLEKEVAITKSLCMDWAAWDDAYRFVSDRNEEFIQSNLQFGAFISNKNNGIIFLDRNGKIVWGKAYDLTTGEDIAISELIPDSIFTTPYLRGHDPADTTKSGLVLTSRGPLIVSMCPIITSKREGPVRGDLLMCRILTRKSISELSESFGRRFTLLPIDEKVFAPEEGKDYSITKDGKDHIKICKAVNDIFGRPTMMIIADVPTPISAKGRWVGSFVSLSVLISGAMAILATFILLKAVVLGRIEELGSQLAKLFSDDEKAQQASKADELGRHSQLVMKMMDRLDSTEHALDASYQRFRTAFINAPFPIIIHDETGKVLQLNRKWTELTGYERGDIPTIDSFCRLASDGKPAELKQALQPHAQDEKQSLPNDHVIMTKDGSRLIWTFSSSLLGSTHGSRQIISIAVDITESQKAQQVLRDNESLFRTLTESIPAVSYLAEVTFDALFTYISPQSRSFFGFSPEQLRNSADPWKLIISGADYKTIMVKRFAAVSEKRCFVGEYHANSRDGEALVVHEEARLVTTAKGPMIQGVIFNITENRQPDSLLHAPAEH